MARPGLFLVSVLLAGLAGCNALPLRKKTVTTQSPETIEKFAMARLLEHQGQRDKAVAIYRGGHARRRQAGRPHAAGPYHRLAVINVAQHRDEKAETYFREPRGSPRATPRSSTITAIGSRCTAGSPRLSASCRAAREADTTDKTVLNNLAVVVGQAGRYGESLALFREATDSEASARSTWPSCW